MCLNGVKGMGIKMKKYLDVLRNCALFYDIADEDLVVMLACLGAKCKSYRKNETVLEEGGPATHLGIVLSGAAQIIRMDYFGNRSILTQLAPSQIFGESFACAGAKVMPVSVVMTKTSDVMLMDVKRITHLCSNACAFHSQIIFNLLKLVAQKNLVFTEKIEITSKRTTREKLMTYLLIQAKQNQSPEFYIPFDRQELADYLEVERSGLSAEISKLRKEGILECTRNFFAIK